MLRGREVFDLIQKSDDKDKIPPTITKILVKIADDHSALKQEILECAKSIDQMSDILLANTHIIENVKKMTDRIRNMRGTADEEDR